MIFQKKFLVMTLALLLTVVMAVPVWAADTFKICLLEVVTGPFKRSGDAYVLALEILAEEINEQGGILGKKVEIIVEDSQNKPDVAVRKARKHLLEGVKVFATGSGTHNALALGELAAKEKVIFISYGAEGESLTGKACGPNTFRVSPNTEQRSMAIANFLATKPFKKFAIINQDYAFGHEAAEGFKRRIKQFIPDAQIVAEEFHPMALKDFGPYISKVNLVKPDVIFTANWVVDLINVIKQSREMGIKVPFMCYYLYDPVAVLPGLGNTAIGSWTCEGYFETVRTPGVKALLERWSKNPKYTDFQRTPSGSIGRAYNGMKHFLQAIKKAGTFDIPKAMKTWEGMEWEGITGKMIMRAEDHQMLMPLFMAEIIPPTNEFYPNLPYIGEPTAISLEKSTVPLNETGCTRKKGQF